MIISVRNIELKDAEGFYNALCCVANERKYILSVEPPPLERIREFVKNNYSQFVAQADNTIIGWARYSSIIKP